MGHNSNSDIYEGNVSGGKNSRDSLINLAVDNDVNVLSSNYECLSVDNHVVESAAINSCGISRSNNIQGHIHDVSVARQSDNCSYCNACGYIVVGKCEHCFNNSIKHNTGYSNMSSYDSDIFRASSWFETRVDFTSHEYNCPINRTTVFIVLLYRAGYQPRFAYFVKYWDFSDVQLFACNCLPPGILSFIYTEYLTIHWCHANGTNGFVSNIIDENDPKMVWQGYQKDCFLNNTFGVTYEQYMEDIIDKLLEHNDVVSSTSENEVDSLASVPAYGTEVKENLNRSHDVVNVDWTIVQNGSDSDINFSDKKLGYLAKQCTDFVFIGPDRQMVEIKDIQQCVNIAHEIRLTGKLNYMEARYPLKSGLNLEAWNRLLFDYPDRKLLQYLAFGFPLSLKEHRTLGNKAIKNHISALQYPEAVDRYLAKELEAGAIIGPMSDINNFHIHCSPLLTRPKDMDKRIRIWIKEGSFWTCLFLMVSQLMIMSIDWLLIMTLLL